MASMFGPLPRTVRLLDAGAGAGALTAVFATRLCKRDEGVQHFIHHLAPHGMAGFVLANDRMSSNQSGDCPARSAMKTPKATPQRQRDIRRALIEAVLLDTALRDSAISQSETTPQILSKAKSNMVALPGQLLGKFGMN